MNLEDKIARTVGCSLSEAADIIRKMSIHDYIKLVEVGPMGAGPTTATTPTTPTTPTNTNTPDSKLGDKPQDAAALLAAQKKLYKGDGKFEPGMTAGINSAGETGEVIRYDPTNEVVLVKQGDGRTRGYNKSDIITPDQIKPTDKFASTALQGVQKGYTSAQSDDTIDVLGKLGKVALNKITGESVEENAALKRLMELAGIVENCSSGATGAGAIAASPFSLGTTKRTPGSVTGDTSHRPTESLNDAESEMDRSKTHYKTKAERMKNRFRRRREKGKE